MADVIKQQENKYIEEMKKGMAKNGGKMSHEMELGMRSAYSSAAGVFRILGQHEGDEVRKQKIIDALGLVPEKVSV